MKINVIIPQPSTVRCQNCEEFVDKVARFNGPEQHYYDRYAYDTRSKTVRTTVDVCRSCLEQGLEALGPRL